MIGDIGYAKELQETASKQNNSNIIFGTNNYLAPEANNASKRTEKLDIWSYGCIIYELFKLEKLFYYRNPDKLRLSITQFNVNKNLDTDKIEPKYVDILKNSLLQEPKQRFTAKQLIDILQVILI